MRIKNFDEFKKRCKKRTLDHFGGWREEAPVEEEKRSEKAEKVRAAILGGGFECRTQAVLDLMSIVIEEDLGRIKDVNKILGKSFYPYAEPGIVFVLSRNENGHNYGIGVANMISREGRAIMHDGSEGNNLPAGKCYYPPTEKEFDDLMASLKGSDIDSDFPIKEMMEEE